MYQSFIPAWGKCTMPLTNINSDWMSNASSGLCINLFILRSSLHLGVYSSITAPQGAHKLVVQVAEWLTASLSGLARHELTTYSLVQALKNKVQPRIYYCLQGKGAHKL